MNHYFNEVETCLENGKLCLLDVDDERSVDVEEMKDLFLEDWTEMRLTMEVALVQPKLTTENVERMR